MARLAAGGGNALGRGAGCLFSDHARPRACRPAEKEAALGHGSESEWQTVRNAQKPPCRLISVH